MKPLAHALFASFVASIASTGCSDGTTGSGGGAAGSTSQTMSTGTGMSQSSASSGTGGSTSLGGPFQYGMNFGYVPGFTDPDMANLARGVGANGARVSFPEAFFEQWGISDRGRRQPGVPGHRDQEQRRLPHEPHARSLERGRERSGWRAPLLEAGEPLRARIAG
jgi:hypothetical protein